MDNIANISIEVQDHHFGGLDGLKSILNNYYENELKQLNETEQNAARRFLEEGLIVSGRRVGITEGVEKERYGIDQKLLEKLLESRLIRVENTHLGKSYEISHDTLVPPIIASYKKRKEIADKEKAAKLLVEEQAKLVVERQKRRRAIVYAIIGFSLFFLSLLMGAIAYNQSSQIKKTADAGKLRGKGYQVAKSNPTVALRFAEASLLKDSENINSKHLMRDLINANPPHFCSKELWIGDYVSSIAFFPDNTYFVATAYDGSLRKWTISGELVFNVLAHKEAIHSVTVSPDGKYILTGSVDNSVKLWDAQGQLVREIGTHITDVQCLKFTPDGNSILTGDWDGKLKMWNLNGELTFDFVGHSDVINDLAISPDGQLLISAGWDKKVMIWNLKEQKLLHTLDAFDYGIESVSFTKDGSQFCTSDFNGKMHFWKLDGEKGNEVEFEGLKPNDIIVSKNSNSIFTAQSDHVIREVDFAGNEIRTFKNHSDEILALGISNDGSYMVSGGRDYKISIWPLNGLITKNIKAPMGVLSFALFPDQEKVLVGGMDTFAYVLDLEGKVLTKFSGHRNRMDAIAVSPDGTLCATGDRQGRFFLWTSTGEQKLAITPFERTHIECVTFSADGQKMLVGGKSREAKLIDLEGNILQTFKGHTSDVKAAIFTPDQQSILTASRDGTARLWNMDGTMIREFIGHEKDLYCIDVSSDGKYVLTGSKDKTGRLWSIDGDSLMVFTGHSNLIDDISFSPDDQYVISSARDKTIKIWDLEGNELQTNATHKNLVMDIDYDPSGNYIWSADIDGRLQKWMTWNTFMNSDRLMTLNEEQKYEFGLIDTPPNSQRKKPIIAMHNASGSPYLNIHRAKDYLTEAQGYNIPGRVRLNGKLGSELEVAKAYNSKGHFSTLPSEKTYYHGKCTDYLTYMFDNWPSKNPPPTNFQNIIIFSYADLCLSMMLENNAEEAYNIAEQGLKYNGLPKTTTLLKSRMALSSFYQGNYESAKAELLAMKDGKLYTSEPPGNYFKMTYEQTHGIDFDTSYVFGDLLLEDIDLLTAHGVTNPNVADLRESLSKKEK